MRATDLSLLRIPSAPTLTPDGRLVAVTVTRIHLDDNLYRSDLWVAPTDGSAAPSRFTNGPRDFWPRFSPDGRWLAFLRAGEGDDSKPQIHVMPVAGGEPWQLCEHPLGVERFSWSPDSTRIAYVARVPEPGRYGTDDDVPPGKEPPRRITTLHFRLDNIGFTFDRRPHVFVIDAAGQDGEPLQITHGDYDHGEPTWSPDGSSIAFVSARHPNREYDQLSDIFVAPSGGGDAVQVTRTTLPVSRPAFSPDGVTIWFCAPSDDEAGRNTGLWSVAADGSTEPRRLTEAERWDVDNFGSGPLELDVEPDAVTTVVLDRGAVHLYRFPTAGGDQRAGVQRLRQLRGLQRHRLGFPARLHRRRPRAGEGAEPAHLCRPDRDADAADPLRGGLALPDRAGATAVRGAQAPPRRGRDAGLPLRGPRAVPLRAAEPSRRPLRGHPGVVGPPPEAARRLTAGCARLRHWFQGGGCGRGHPQVAGRDRAHAGGGARGRSRARRARGGDHPRRGRHAVVPRLPPPLRAEPVPRHALPVAQQRDRPRDPRPLPAARGRPAVDRLRRGRGRLSRRRRGDGARRRGRRGGQAPARHHPAGAGDGHPAGLARQAAVRHQPRRRAGGARGRVRDRPRLRGAWHRPGHARGPQRAERRPSRQGPAAARGSGAGDRADVQRGRRRLHRQARRLGPDHPRRLPLRALRAHRRHHRHRPPRPHPPLAPPGLWLRRGAAQAGPKSLKGPIASRALRLST